MEPFGTLAPVVEDLERRMLLDGGLADLSQIMLGWNSSYDQGSASGHRFHVEVEGAQNVLNAAFVTPTGGQYDLVAELSGNEWIYEHPADTFEELEVLFTAGVYQFTFEFPSGTYSTSISVDPLLSRPVAIPTWTSPTLGQSDVSTDVLLTWETVAEPDFELVLVDMSDYFSEQNVEFAEEFLPNTATSVLVEGLTANRVYAGALIFGNVEFATTAEDVPYIVAFYNDSQIVFSTNDDPGRFDIVDEVMIMRVNSGDIEEFSLEIEFTDAVMPQAGPALITGAVLRTPGGHWLDIFAPEPGEYVEDSWLDLYFDNLDPAGELILQTALGDGWYVLVMDFGGGEQAVTPFWFGLPDSSDPLEMLSQDPAFTSPAPGGSVISPVSIQWAAVTDPAATLLYFEVTEDGEDDAVFEDTLAPSVTSQSVTLEPGEYTASLFAGAFYGDIENADGIVYSVGKVRTASLEFAVEEETPDLADLVIDFGRINLPEVFVPGDRARATVIVGNIGDIRAEGAVTVSLYLSTAAELGMDAILLDQITREVAIRPGGSQSFRFAGTMSESLPPGTYYLIATVETPIEEASEANNIVVDATPREMVWRFGNVGDRQNVRMTFAEDLEGVLHFRLSGPGYGEVVATQDGFDIVFTGTTIRSIARIVGTGGTGWAVQNVTVGGGGSLGGLIAPTTDLYGDIDVDGLLRQLTLNDVLGDASAITIRGQASAAADRAALRFGNVSDLTIDAHDVPLSILHARQWIDTDGTRNMIEVAGIRSMTVLGDMDVDLYLTSDEWGRTLGQGRVLGEVLGGEWEINGDTGTLTLGGTTADWEVAFYGSVRQLRFVDDASGLIQADSIGLLRVDGNMNSATVWVHADPQTATPLTLGRLIVRGYIWDSDIRSAGSIGRVVASDLLGSTIHAGMDLDAEALAETGDIVNAQATIRDVNLGGGAFLGSYLSAPTIGRFRNAVLSTDNLLDLGTPYGVATGRIGRLQVLVDGEAIVERNVTEGVVAEDLVLRII